MTHRPMNVGIVGCGNISPIYLKNLTGLFSRYVKVVAISDLVPEKELKASEAYGIPNMLTLEEMAARSDIEMILNITEPFNHAKVSDAILTSGKHAYSEKPLGITREEGSGTVALAKGLGLRMGGAPDTFLGGGLQTCRKLIDDGWIGEPLAADAFMLGHGPEHWHPDPAFFYQKGGGPMFDMGPYYLTALVHLLGPIASISGMTSKGFAERRATSANAYGQILKVETPTHLSGSLRFASGAIGTLITSFDVWGSQAPRIEVHGTRGSLVVPDPNTFGGPILYKRGRDDWSEVPMAFGYQTNSRGLGFADMVCAIREDRPARASSDLTFHVLDAMVAFHESSEQRREIALASSCERPAPLPLGLADGEI